ncbi:hypothetical protein NGF75_08260 [Dietzia kunjamensis]|uniref:hypothetical protein n=1 Tax=Dietzia kunjamensis TaxID=322509 RepID=UPI002DB61965|nr:hypothetical protein [Dietzia kunjamensis]MEB8325980.1 hypothetical protein [Dietzia kunjamensis]
MEFGSFAVAWAIYLLATGTIRAGVAESALAKGDLQAARHRVAGAFWVAMFLGAAVISIGFLLDQFFLLAVGCFLPALTIFEYVRIIEMALGRGKIALGMDSVWALASILILCATIFFTIPSVVLFSVWAAVPSVVVVLLFILSRGTSSQRVSLRPSFANVRLAFMADYLIGSGSMQVAISLLPVVASTATVGAIRGAGTILSPITLITSTMRPLLIASAGQISTGVSATNMLVKRFIVVNLLLLLVSLPLVVAASLLPDRIGNALLGPSWQAASTIIIPIGVESISGLLAATAFAAHRVKDAARRVLVVRSVLAVVRVGSVLVTGAMYGVDAVAWAMALVSVAGLIIWSCSYFQLEASSQRRTIS